MSEKRGEEFWGCVVFQEYSSINCVAYPLINMYNNIFYGVSAFVTCPKSDPNPSLQTPKLSQIMIQIQNISNILTATNPQIQSGLNGMHIWAFFLNNIELFETRRPRDKKIIPRQDVFIVVVFGKNRHFLIWGLPFALSTQNRGEKFKLQFGLELNLFFWKIFKNFFAQMGWQKQSCSKNFWKFFRKQLTLLFWGLYHLYRAKGRRPHTKKSRFFPKIITSSRIIIFLSWGLLVSNNSILFTKKTPICKVTFEEFNQNFDFSQPNLIWKLLQILQVELRLSKMEGVVQYDSNINIRIVGARMKIRFPVKTRHDCKPIISLKKFATKAYSNIIKMNEIRIPRYCGFAAKEVRWLWLVLDMCYCWILFPIVGNWATTEKRMSAFFSILGQTNEPKGLAWHCNAQTKQKKRKNFEGHWVTTPLSFWHYPCWAIVEH